jgi:hypothetical protein
VLLKTLVRKLESEFSSLRFTVDEEKHVVIIPPIHEEIGSIEIEDDLNELIVIVGNFTHWHAGCYREELSDIERSEAVAEDVVGFLHDLFNDKIVMWGSHKGGGGFTYRDNMQSQASYLGKHQKWLWSGLLSE